MITSIDHVLEIYGNGIDADDFAEQLDVAMRRRINVDPRALSLHDRAVLTSVGVSEADWTVSHTAAWSMKPPDCLRTTRWPCRRPRRPNALAGR